MNRMMDEQAGETKLSVWPMYLVAGVIVTLSLLMSISLAVLLVSTYYDKVPYKSSFPTALASLLRLIPYSLWSALGLSAAWGLIRLRAWGWWCAVAWVAGALGWLLFALITQDISLAVDSLWPALSFFFLLSALFIFVIWALVARRRVFFPLNPEVEE